MATVDKTEAAGMLGHSEEASLYRIQRRVRTFVDYAIPIIAAVIVLAFFTYCAITATIGPIF